MGDLAAKHGSHARGQRPQPAPVLPRSTTARQASDARIRSILEEDGAQPKLTIGAPNDVHEVEADRIADRVLSNQTTGTILNRLGTGNHPQAATPEPLQKAAEAQAPQRASPTADLQAQPDQLETEKGTKASVPRTSLPANETGRTHIQAKADAGTLDQGKHLKYAVNVEDPEGEPEQEVQARTDLTHASADSPPPRQAPSARGSAGTSLRATKGGGAALPAQVREDMESRFGADFSGVRVHTGNAAASMSSEIRAQAFTHGNDIYFNEGRYDPGSSAGRHLLAHELTHTIQQGAARQNADAPLPVRNKTDEEGAPKIQRNWLGDAWDAVSGAVGDAVDFVADQLNAALDYVKGLFTDFVQRIPGYKLLSVIIGKDPVTGETVAQNGLNFIEAGLDVIPFGDLFKRKLEQTGKLQEAAAWLDQRMKSLEGVSLSAILEDLSRFWDSLSITDVRDVTGVLERAANIIRRPVATIVSFCGDVATYFLKLIKDFLLRELSEFVASQQSARGFPLLTVILGKNPITDETVERNGMNLIRGFMLLSADGPEQLRQMEESGSLQRAAQWIDTSVAQLGLAWEGIKNAFSNAWALITIENLVTDPIGTFTAIVDQFVAPVTIIIDFVVEVASMILKFIKDALLQRLSTFARGTRGYPLLTVLLGQDPFTEAPVERNPENLIHGFMALMEGGEEQFQQMKQSGAIANMTDRIERAVATLNFTWEYITGLFTTAWESFSLRDLAAPVDAFLRIMRIFADPIVRLFDFVVEVVKIAIEVVLRVMQFPFNLVENIIAKATQAFNDIKRDPIGFLKNLLRAVKTGFAQFFDNIGTHLLNGLTSWLFKELGEAGITPPADLSLRSIVGFVLDVLGISLDKIFEKLAAKIGQERVARIRAMGERLTGAWTFISDVMERGPVAIWEYVQEKLSSLWNMVLDAISNWVVTRVINQVTAKLLSMLDPTGIMAVVNGFIAFFKAVQSFIAYLREMLEIVNSFVEGVAEIAAGSVTSAANFLEGALARAVPVAIGFLANQVGLSGLGRRIGEMVETVREKVDQGIDWLIDKAMSAGTSIMNMFRGGRDQQQQQQNGPRSSGNSLEGMSIAAILAMPPSAEPRDAAQKQRDVDDAAALVRRIAGNEHDTGDVGEHFAAIKTRFGLREIAFKEPGKPAGRIEVSINPKATIGGDELDEAGKMEWTGPLQTAAFDNDVTFSGATRLTGAPDLDVATKMEAKMLGPNHPMGSQTGAGSINSVMSRLTRAAGSTESGFVAGHLLNYDLGGPGDNARNLYPITGHANSQHFHEVESIVKGWVNESHYWVTYTVEAVPRGHCMNGTEATNYVDADFICEAHPKRIDGQNAKGGFRKTIQSRHDKRTTPTESPPSQRGTGSAQSDRVFDAAGGVPETVPQRERTGGPPRTKVPIMSATEAQLRQLDGITAARAKKILKNKPYRTHAELEDLLGKNVWDSARATATFWPVINESE